MIILKKKGPFNHIIMSTSQNVTLLKQLGLYQIFNIKLNLTNLNKE